MIVVEFTAKNPDEVLFGEQWMFKLGQFENFILWHEYDCIDNRNVAGIK